MRSAESNGSPRRGISEKERCIEVIETGTHFDGTGMTWVTSLRVMATEAVGER